MSQRPIGPTNGIFSLFFREAGFFWEQAWQWAQEQAAEDRKEMAQDDDRRRTEAIAKLLEQARLAKEAGLDVDKILAQVGEDVKRTKS